VTSAVFDLIYAWTWSRVSAARGQRDMLVRLFTPLCRLAARRDLVEMHVIRQSAQVLLFIVARCGDWVLNK
jgi:hypothetical protein